MYNNYTPRAGKRQGETSNKIKRVMKIVAVTAEFNPLHNGHLRLLEKAKSLSPDVLLVILNGNFTQRGELALVDKYSRAKHAMLAGADAVIELPQMYGVACAERFADAAVKLVAALPAEEKILAFGSEEGELVPLENAANVLSEEPEELSLNLRELMDMGLSYPAARAQAFAAYTQEKGIAVSDLTKPNNILAIEYLRAIKKRGGVTPYTVKRSGNYHGDKIDSAEPSASALRAALCSERKEEALAALPAFVKEDLKDYEGKNYLSPLLLYRLSEMTAAELRDVADVSEGIENRILRLAKECADAEALVKAVSTKRYTESRVRRILANALLRVDQDTFECGIDAAPYYKVLAVKKQRTDILSLFSRAGTLLTGEQEAKESGIPSAVIDAKAHDLYRVATAAELEDGMILL